MTDFILLPILPELFLTVAALTLLMIGVFEGNSSTRMIVWLSAGAALIALLMLIGLPLDGGPVIGGMVALTAFSAVLKGIILLGVIASLALSARYIVQENLERFEFPILILFATVGMLLMVSATHMLSLYVALELQSLSLYVLAAFRRDSLRSSEAGVKYFSLGALSSGMLLFGMSLIYGAVGALDFASIAALATSEAPLTLTAGMVFVLAGLAFKISAVPFHMWTPDVYQGSPSAVTAFFAIVPKVAAIGLFALLLFGPFAALADQWKQILYALSLGSMLVGAFAGLAQNDIKRLLAYSSIGNMGYALIGLIAGGTAGVSAVIFYMLVYMLVTAGLFGLVLSMRRNDLMSYEMTSLAGLSRTHPMLAYAMTALLFSMAGIPPLAGFFSKLVIFQAAMGAELYILATIGVVSSVVAAYYYLRLIKIMFFDKAEEPLDSDIPLARTIVIGVATAFALIFIAKATFVLDLAEFAANGLLSG